MTETIEKHSKKEAFQNFLDLYYKTSPVKNQNQSLAFNAYMGIWGAPSETIPAIIPMLKNSVSKMKTTNNMRYWRVGEKLVINCGCVDHFEEGYSGGLAGWADMEGGNIKCHHHRTLARPYGSIAKYNYPDACAEMVWNGIELENWQVFSYMAYKAAMENQGFAYDYNTTYFQMGVVAHRVIQLIEENPTLAPQKEIKFKPYKYQQLENHHEQLGDAYAIVRKFYGCATDVYRHLNPSLFSVLKACISGGVKFGLGDFVEMSERCGLWYWIGEDAEETVYSFACRQKHISACKAWEAARGRIPWLVDNHRIGVGQEFSVGDGRTSRITKIENRKGSDGTIRVKSFVKGEWDNDRRKYAETEIKLQCLNEEQWFGYTLGAKISV